MIELISIYLSTSKKKKKYITSRSAKSNHLTHPNTLKEEEEEEDNKAMKVSPYSKCNWLKNTFSFPKYTKACCNIRKLTIVSWRKWQNSESIVLHCDSNYYSCHSERFFYERVYLTSDFLWHKTYQPHALELL